MEPPQAQERSPLDALSGERMENNMRKINTSRVVVAVMSGVTAGVLGLTGFPGLFFFAFWILLLAVVMPASGFACVTWSR